MKSKNGWQKCWSFLLIIVVPDIILDQIVFFFGYPAGGDKTLPENIRYISGKDIAVYNIDWAYNPELIANEYTYYEVESYWELGIGDKVTFQNYELYVGAVTIELKDGILIYTAKLVRKLTLRQNPIYNEKIQGVSLEGTVLALQNQEIKLQLDIDQEQDEGTAYWYLATIIFLAFGLLGANKWRMNQEKLYIADEEKSKTDKLVLFIISFPIVVVFFMLLLKG